MRLKILIFPILIFLVSSCGIVKITPIEAPEESPPTEINAVPPAQEGDAQTEPGGEAAAEAQAGESESANVSNDPADERLPLHGLPFALYPLLIIGVGWVIIELIIVRIVQPRGEDVAYVRIKAQDGLFLEANVSMTARRTLTLATTRMTWGRVRDFVEKTIEQELLHAATQFPTLEDLERNLKNISDSFGELPIVRVLSRDFGLEVLWFNIEITYPRETMDALNRKAEASADGTAYLAYAAAAHLDPDSSEARELYRVYQITSGRVDAARNLGGGLSGLADLLTRRSRQTGDGDNESASNT